MRLTRLCRRKKRVLWLNSHGRMCHLRIVVVLLSAQRWMTRWLSLILPQGLPRNRTSPPSLGVREYVHTYISHINKLSLTALSHRTHTLVETNSIQIKTYNIQMKTIPSLSPVFNLFFEWKIAKKSQVFISPSITFHYVYFELSTVPKRETIQGSRSWKSSPVFSRLLLLLSLY